MPSTRSQSSNDVTSLPFTANPSSRSRTSFDGVEIVSPRKKSISARTSRSGGKGGMGGVAKMDMSAFEAHGERQSAFQRDYLRREKVKKVETQKIQEQVLDDGVKMELAEQAIENIIKEEIETPTKRRRTTTTTTNTSQASKTPNSIKVESKPSIPSTRAKKPTAGTSPFPSFPHPTPSECRTVRDLLVGMHGIPQRSHKETPSLEISGCGEVPSVLDALLRTVLSAATSLANSNRAFQGLIKTYGVVEEGVGKGSVDWEKVRRGSEETLFETIRCGGLAKMKSKNIKKILEIVREENLAMIKRMEDGPKNGEEEEDTKVSSDISNMLKEEATLSSSLPIPTSTPTLSLDHLHLLPTPLAREHLESLPGIGPKTAACVLMFCMQRDVFPVDTHVWRLCKWLGWTKEGANRDATYLHCDAMIPNELKFDLHVLFWQHGSRCPKCRMIPVSTHTEFDDMDCPIEHLVKRDNGNGNGRKKGGGTPKKGGKKKRKRARDESEAEESEFSE